MMDNTSREMEVLKEIEMLEIKNTNRNNVGGLTIRHS